MGLPHQWYSSRQTINALFLLGHTKGLGQTSKLTFLSVHVVVGLTLSLASYWSKFCLLCRVANQHTMIVPLGFLTSGI